MPEDSADTRPAETRKLIAIMFTDIVGFSRQIGADEARMLRMLAVHNQVIQQAVADYHGHVIKTMGDAFLVDFPSVVHAVQCAQYIQARFRTQNAEKEKAEQIHVRIGIHLGDIIQQNGDVLGDGVNVASRLQALAEPDTICISQGVYREVEKKLSLGTVVSLGRPKLKNIAQRERVYALLPEPPKGLRQTLRVQRLKLKQRRRTLQGAVLLGLLLGAGVVGRYLYFPASSTLPLPDKPSLVVLPFVNMSGDPEREYFSDGITEDLTSDLSKLSGLFVIARNSAFTYKGKAVKVQDVGRELGVRYVLEGSVRKADEQVRITVQLIEATTGYHVWSERYDRLLKDIFTLQDEVTQQIVAALRVEVLEAEMARVRRISTENLTAYDFYLRSRESLFRAVSEANKEANVHARQMAEKAIELDPQYAEAYASSSLTYFVEWFYLWNPTPQVVEQFRELARKALALDDSLPVAHQVLSFAYLAKRQHEQAIVEAERALALDPNSPEAYRFLGINLVWAGRPGEGIDLLQKAMRLNPRYQPMYLVNLGWAYTEAGRCEEALVPLKQALSLVPDSMDLHVMFAVCYARLGQEAEAQAEAAEVLRINPNFSLEMGRNTWPYKDPAMLERMLTAMRKAGLK